jgi:hypothetical protein
MSAQTLHFVPSADFRSRTAEAVSDPQPRRSFRGAMDFRRANALRNFRMRMNWKRCAHWAKPCVSMRCKTCRNCWSNWNRI